MAPSMPKVITFAWAGVSFGSVSCVQLVTSIVKLLPSEEASSSIKTKTCCPVVSDKHLISSELLKELRFAAAMTGPIKLLQVNTPGAGHDVETYNTRLLTRSKFVTLNE